MKILYLVPHLSTGGMPQYTYLIMKKLVETGHEIHCVEFQDIAPVYRVQKDRIISLLGKNRFRCLGEDKNELFNILDVVKPDVLHIEEIVELAWFEDEICKRIYDENRSYKIIETTHNQGFNVKEGKKYIPDGFVFVSEAHVSKYEHFDVPHEVIFPELEKKERPDRSSILQSLGLDPDKKHVLNVGLFTERKNQGEVFDIARRLVDIEFHFIGNQAGNFSDYWQPIMDNKPDNCVIWGERSDVDLFYSCMDMFLFASKPLRGDQETCPMVIKEALSWDMPVYCYRMDTYGDMYDDNAMVTYMTDMYQDVFNFFNIPNKCYVVSSYTDEMEEQYKVSNSNFAEYCTKHNYNLRYFKDILSDSGLERNSVWSKVKAIQNVFDECNNGDLILWLDADIVITNQDIMIEDMIGDGSDISCELNPDKDYKLSVFVMRKSDFTSKFVSDWWESDYTKFAKKAEDLGYTDNVSKYSVMYDPDWEHEVHFWRVVFGHNSFTGFEEYKNIFNELDSKYTGTELDHDSSKFSIHVPGGLNKDGNIILRNDLERSNVMKSSISPRPSDLPKKAFLTHCDENYLDLAENLIRSINLNSDYPIILYTINCDAEFDYPNLHKIRYDDSLEPVPGEEGIGNYWILGIKPKLFLDALGRGVDTIVYLDSDIIVKENIDTIWENELDNFPLGNAHCFQFCILNDVLEPGWEMMNYLGVDYPKPSFENITEGKWSTWWYRQGCFSMFDRKSEWFIKEWWDLCCHSEMLKDLKKYYPYREETPYNVLFAKHGYDRKLPQMHVNIVDYDHYLRFTDGLRCLSPGFSSVQGGPSYKTIEGDSHWTSFDANYDNIKIYHGLGDGNDRKINCGNSIIRHMGGESDTKFYSDHGEDEWIYKNIFHMFGKNGFYVDVGAAHPTENSNTAFLRDLGWDGVCIDANPHWMDMWEEKNINFANVAISSTETEIKMLVPYLTSNPDELLPQCTTRVDSDYQIGGNCGEVNAVAVTLDKIIEEYSISEIDILDIDVEGFELDVWRSLTKIKPKVVIVEYDTQGVIKTECRDAILDTNEYNLIYSTKINDIFMLNSLIKDGLRPKLVSGGGHAYVDHPDSGSLKWLKSKFDIKSLLDIGCAYGSHVKIARTMDIDAVGVDGDWCLPYYKYKKWNDYTKSSCLDIENMYFDVGWSVEFVEHIEEKYIDNYMKDFKKCKYVVLTSCEVDGEGHVNVNPVEYWIEMFEKYGFKYSQEQTDEFREASTIGTGEDIPPGWTYGTFNAVELSGMFFYNTKFKGE